MNVWRKKKYFQPQANATLHGRNTHSPTCRSSITLHHHSYSHAYTNLPRIIITQSKLVTICIKVFSGRSTAVMLAVYSGNARAAAAASAPWVPNHCMSKQAVAPGRHCSNNAAASRGSAPPQQLRLCRCYMLRGRKPSYSYTCNSRHHAQFHMQ